MMATTVTLEQVRVAGYQALSRELGPVNLVRFLQQFESGCGDYTRERSEWLDQYTVEEIAREVERHRDVE